MKTLARSALIIATAALFTACRGSQPPVGASGAMPQTVRSTQRATSGGLLYVGLYAAAFDIYTFPGGKYLGEYHTPDGTIPVSFCSDGQGDVYMTGAASQVSSGHIYEYAHGGTTPIATLNVPSPYEAPVACSSDPTTGDLAVISYDENTLAANVAIYKNTQGTPTVFTGANINSGSQPGYDNLGNLYITSGTNVLSEIPSGGGSVEQLTLSQNVGLARRLQWDGKYLALQADSTKQGKPKDTPVRVYRIQVTGSTAEIVGKVDFNGWNARTGRQCWIQGNKLAAPAGRKILIWKYAGGGKPLESVQPPSREEVMTLTVSVGNE